MAFELGKLLAEKKFYTEALEIFTRAIDLSPLPPSRYYVHRGSVYDALGLLQLTQKDFASALEADPELIPKYE